MSSGDLRSATGVGVVMPHEWTDEGVTVESEFTGGHLYHLSAAGCILNDVYREAARLGITVRGVRVRASGGFDREWSSTGIGYEVDVSSPATPAELDQLLAVVDGVAEIPKALRSGTTVARRSA